jgi:hypothetical protein
LLPSPWLTIETEDCLLRLLLELGLELEPGFDRSKFLAQIEISLLSKERHSLFLDEISLDGVSEEIWQKIVSHLKGLSPAARHLRSSHPFSDSLILHGIRFVLKNLRESHRRFCIGDRGMALLHRHARRNEARVFRMKADAGSSYVILCGISYGPIFGSNNDIAVYRNCNANVSNFTNLGGIFVNDMRMLRDQVFTGEQHFRNLVLDVIYSCT